ncbi:MAG: Type III restriction-modification enzyme,R/helicase subunit [Candidatus Woesebacteria bacterium GW2011_GWA1_41_13b]|uniref:Type III restriction-modification enzyme,R/helicase subunit n=1 Tax=Candidatus Woesebacteria bacterium GW2011_GWA1_41_13b TaxID=1618555 RepID=A0A0G0X5V9_9BACT|nr:MAG: Type III restriction-modification enzyme,R/helicase subunit [Candidatus Woesebacteria bacterium GW2011_GWA1_41_13b]
MAKTTFILNTPYVEPIYHFKSDDRGLTPEINEFRRPSSFYIPVPKSKNKSKQMELNTAEGAYGSEIQRDNVFINRLREKLSEWRKQNYPGLTKTSRDLLFYWNDESRTNKLFFCQIEALETLMYATEVAEKSGEGWIINELRQKNTEANPGLYRMAFKMATGSGKTVVMAMMIAYNTLNKIRYPMDTRFTDAFVVVTPGITIRDRLNVLLPNDPHNYYLQRDIVSYQDFDLLQQAVVHIVNFQQLELRQNPRYQMGGVLKASGLINEAAIKETPNAMVNRVFKSLMGKPRVLVLNDEAHHCYREKPMEAKLTGDDREEADKNNKAARVWISGLEALAQKMEVNAIIDLSATPYFLRGSGYPEGELFPWVVSDFSLLDALECGIVKIPRLPVSADNITENDEPEFRNLWLHVRDDLPKKGLKTGDYDLSSVLVLPTKLSEALLSLYKSYESYYKVYEEAKRSNPDVMPPVMIVVCNNTTVSELVYRWVAGYERQLASGKAMMEKGNLDIFRNEDGVNFLDKPNTLIIDSEKLESGEKIDENFKKIFEKEISDYHKEYRIRFPGREDPTDEELLREVMNTVGKSGKLGENIKCVVSVSMLTEGWDVNTVTHILGIRAFSTQLLCEQVVGRALRRIDYTADEETGLMREEYAEVYGVPFNFLRVEGNPTPQPPKVIHRVHSLDDREQYQITFPRVQGYRFELNEETLAAHFTDDSRTVIENEPTQVILGGMIGEETTENMEKIKERRQGEVVTRLSEALLKRYYTSADGQVKYWLFPQIKRIAEEYVTKYVVLKDKMVIGYLSVGEYFSGALTKIQQAIIAENISRTDEKKILPILAPYDSEGSTRYVDFLTTKEVRETVKSHINYVVADTEEWEQGVAKKLEEMPEVLAYVKNQNLGFSIPYEYEGISRQYITDFIVKLEMPDKSILNLLIEVTGLKRDQKAVKVKTAKELWIPAVNNAERFGKWAIIEIQDIHQTQQLIRFGMTQGFANEVN